MISPDTAGSTLLSSFLWELLLQYATIRNSILTARPSGHGEHRAFRANNVIAVGLKDHLKF